MGCGDILTVRVEQGGIKLHLERRQRVIGRLLFEANRIKKETTRDTDAEVPLSVQTRQKSEAPSWDTHKSKFGCEYTALLIDVQQVVIEIRA